MSSLRFRVREYLNQRLLAHPSATVAEKIIDVVTEFADRQERSLAVLREADRARELMGPALDMVTHLQVTNELLGHDLRALHSQLALIANTIDVAFDTIEETLTGVSLLDP